MAVDLLTVFKKTDLKEMGHTAANLIQLAFKVNKKSGTRIARAVLDNGETLIKEITASGVEIGKTIKLPQIASIAQRNSVIRDLAKSKHTQETIAAMLNISQSTVSNVLRKK